jgi:hypothetical protein
LHKLERSLGQRFENRPFVVLGVNTDLQREELVQVQAKDQLPFRSWCDGPYPGDIARQWGANAFPTVYLIDHRGQVRFHPEGPLTMDSLAPLIEQLVREAEQQAREKGK